MLTKRGIAITSVAYIMAISTGIYSVTELSYAEMRRQAQASQVEATPVNPLDKYRGLRKLTQDELVGLLSAVGFKGMALKTAWAVAMRESNGRPIAHNDNVNTGDNSYGIFQINMIGSLGEDRRQKYNLTGNLDLFDPVTNAQIVFEMTKGGTDWSSWGLGPNAYDGSHDEPSITKWIPLFPGTFTY